VGTEIRIELEIEISGKMDEFSRKRSESPLGKLKLWKNLWMSFPGFAK